MTAFLTGTNRGLGGLRVDDASTDVFGVNHIVFSSGATLTDNGNGKVSIAISGGGGGSMTSWTVAGASGSTTVTDGQTVTITGSGGITTAESGRTVTITPTGVLEDLNTLGAPSANGEFIVATGAGAFAYESGATVRTSLGLGTMALQNAGTVAITGGSIDAVAITGGSITGITDLAIADGGTGAGTAAGARTNLGLGTMALENTDDVTITGGVINSRAPILSIPDGASASLNDVTSGYLIFCEGTATLDLGAVTLEGFQVTITLVGVGTVTINAGGGQTINGGASVALSTQYNAVSIVGLDATTFFAIGV
jgi:hypothetical protein